MAKNKVNILRDRNNKEDASNFEDNYISSEYAFGDRHGECIALPVFSDMNEDKEKADEYSIYNYLLYYPLVKDYNENDDIDRREKIKRRTQQIEAELIPLSEDYEKIMSSNEKKIIKKYKNENRLDDLKRLPSMFMCISEDCKSGENGFMNYESIDNIVYYLGGKAENVVIPPQFFPNELKEKFDKPIVVWYNPIIYSQLNLYLNDGLVRFLKGKGSERLVDRLKWQYGNVILTTMNEDGSYSGFDTLYDMKLHAFLNGSDVYSVQDFMERNNGTEKAKRWERFSLDPSNELLWTFEHYINKGELQANVGLNYIEKVKSAARIEGKREGILETQAELHRQINNELYKGK